MGSQLLTYQYFQVNVRATCQIPKCPRARGLHRMRMLRAMSQWLLAMRGQKLAHSLRSGRGKMGTSLWHLKSTSEPVAMTTSPEDQAALPGRGGRHTDQSLTISVSLDCGVLGLLTGLFFVFFVCLSLQCFMLCWLSRLINDHQCGPYY